MNGVDVGANAQKQLEQPMSLNISKVIDVEGLILRPDAVLIKAIVKTVSGIIMVGDAGGTSVDKLLIIRVGSAVTAYKPGDLVIDITNAKAIMYMHKDSVDGLEDERYAVTNEYNINIATAADNVKE